MGSRPEPTSGVQLALIAVAASVALVPLLASAQGAGGSGTRSVPAPAPDPRLARRVTECQASGSLAQYLDRLTRSTGVQHAVKPPFDERPLIALNMDLSLGELHRAIAHDYEATWRSSGNQPPRYTLVESPGNRIARQSALRAARQRGWQQMLARLDQVRRMASLSPDELARLEEAGERFAHALRHPRGAALTRLGLGLPNAAFEQLWKTGDARVEIASLPQALQDLANAAANPLPGSGNTPANGSIRLSIAGRPDRPTIWVAMKYGTQGFEGNLLYFEGGFARELPKERRQRVEAAPSRAPDDPRFKQKVTLRDPDREKVHDEPGARPPEARPLAPLLEELAKQVKIPIVAECENVAREKPEYRVWVNRQEWLPEDIVDQPLTKALDLLCADFEMEWRFEQGALLLRPRLWYVAPGEREFVVPPFG